MSKLCDFRCGRPSVGNLGLLRYCVECMARLTGWEPDDPRLRQRCAIQLTDDGAEVGWAEWVPDGTRHEPSVLEIRI